MGQTCRQLSTRVKEPEGAVRRQDENSLLALHCLTTGHAFDWDRAFIIGKISEKYLLPQSAKLNHPDFKNLDGELGITVIIHKSRLYTFLCYLQNLGVITYIY